MRYSRQREQILEFVKSVRTHPTAETVYYEMRKKDPNISLGTVYRNLVTLSEKGDITRIPLANKKDRFDGDTSSHVHMICEKCGMISDLFLEELDHIHKRIEKENECKVLSHNITFNTICSKCQ